MRIAAAMLKEIPPGFGAETPTLTWRTGKYIGGGGGGVGGVSGTAGVGFDDVV